MTAFYCPIVLHSTKLHVTTHNIPRSHQMFHTPTCVWSAGNPPEAEGCSSLRALWNALLCRQLARKSLYKVKRSFKFTTQRISWPSMQNDNWINKTFWSKYPEMFQQSKKKTKLHGLSPRANYTDRATTACRRSDCKLFADIGCYAVSVTNPLDRILGFLDRSRYLISNKATVTLLWGRGPKK
jgi:hypothetical protein